jgi:hypothetical protein
MLMLSLTIWSPSGSAQDFSAHIRTADLLESQDAYLLCAEIDYQLSPIAKEALEKGVPLAWEVLFRLSESAWLLQHDVYSSDLAYRLQYNALLNHYEIIRPDGQSEMFLSLNAALNFMSAPRARLPYSMVKLKDGHRYQLAVKSRFNRELLPVPLRPFAYLDTAWFLSSDWYVWPIQK